MVSLAEGVVAAGPLDRDPWRTASEPTEPAAETALPKNFLLKAFFVVAAAIVWAGYGVGKLLFYTVVVLLFLTGSVIELILALMVMPITLLLRMIGHGDWPVEIGRQGRHVGTRRARDFAAAGELRDGLLTEIERGELPAEQTASTG